MPAKLNFSLRSQLGMQILPDLVVEHVYAGGQAATLGVEAGWVITAVMEGQQLHTMNRLDELQAVIAAIKAGSDGHPFCSILFREDSPRPRPAAQATPARCSSSTAGRAETLPGSTNTSTDEHPLSPEMRSGALAAGCWFTLKFCVGNRVNEWLGGALAFSCCAVVAVGRSDGGGSSRLDRNRSLSQPYSNRRILTPRSCP